jgi:galactonate dehydratase
MKITDLRLRAVHVNHRGNWLFVQVHTDAGLIGTGEASHSTDDHALARAIAGLRSRLIGTDPTEIEARFRELARPNAGMIAWTAFSAIEQALWDLLGQAAGVPVYQLLGGRCLPVIRLYANVNRAAANREPAAYAECAQRAVEDGFRAVKCAPFDDVSWQTLDHPEGRRAFDRGLERVRRIRAAIGDGIELSVDCHNRFDRPTALRVAQALAAERLYWLEAPVPPWEPAALAEVKAGMGTRLAAGEELLGRAAFRPLLEARAVDVVMFDVKHTGGLLESKKIAALAEAWGLAVSPHSPSGPVASLASAHLACTLPNLLTLEFAWGEVPWREELVEGAEAIRDGCLWLGDQPGLGLTLNEGVLASHAVEL